MYFTDEKDYIMRMIKEMVRVLFSLMFGKKYVSVSSFYYWNNHRYPISRNRLLDRMGDMAYYVCFVAY